MAQIIKPKTGSGTPPLGSLQDREIAVDLTNYKLFIRHGGGVQELSASVSWGDVTGKPSTFPPSTHTHVKADITDFADADYATAAQGSKADTIYANGLTSPGFSATTGILSFIRLGGGVMPTTDLNGRWIVDGEDGSVANFTVTEDQEFSGVAARIKMRVDEAVYADKAAFVPSTDNTAMTLTIAPSGTSTIAVYDAFAASSDFNNSAYMRFGIYGSDITFGSNSAGTASPVPMKFSFDALDAMYMETDGKIGVGTNSPTERLHVAGDFRVEGAIRETAYTLSGTTPTLNPSNGTRQNWTLTANSTPVDGLSDGESMVLRIYQGSGDSYTVTWPTIQWDNGLPAPAIRSGEYTRIVVYKDGTTLKGAY